MTNIYVAGNAVVWKDKFVEKHIMDINAETRQAKMITSDGSTYKKQARTVFTFDF